MHIHKLLRTYRIVVYSSWEKILANHWNLAYFCRIKISWIAFSLDTSFDYLKVTIIYGVQILADFENSEF